MLGLRMGINKSTTIQIVRNGLVLYADSKDFTNSPPTSLLRDRSGNANDATPNNFGYVNTSGANGSGGLVLDGTNDYLDFGNKSTFDFTSNFTIELSIKFATTIVSTFTSILGKFVTGQQQGYDLGLQNGAVRFAVRGTSNIDFGSGIGSDLRDNKKHHIVLLATNSALYYYLDGQLIYTMPGTWTPTTAATASLKMGTRDNLSYITSTLYAFRIYNRILLPTEITQNYNASK